MAGNAENRGSRRLNRWRIAAWAVVPALLLVPLIAMQFSDEVKWTPFDFASMGALLIGVGVAFELALRMTSNTSYRAAVALALAGAFLLVWVNGAVGIIGSEDNAANLLYGGVLAIGIGGAVIARFRADGIARALFAAAAAQVAIGAIALIAGLGESGESWPRDVLGLTAFFTALWLTSAALFGKASREQAAR